MIGLYCLMLIGLLILLAIVIGIGIALADKGIWG